MVSLASGGTADQIAARILFERKELALSIGDRVRFTKNVKHRGQRFLKNEMRIVVGIDERKIVFEKGQRVSNGAALQRPP
jgi:hypothetical protein